MLIERMHPFVVFRDDRKILKEKIDSMIQSLKSKINSILLKAFTFLFFTSCVSIPQGIQPISNFQLEKYLGKWHEIARLDHSFERGLSNVTAEYSLKEDGSVKVLNRGFLDEKKIWKQAEGKASFVENKDKGYLKVSFFGPFYGAYIIFDLDNEKYQYSMVCGPDRGYLWILSRTPKISDDLKDRLIQKASASGFDTSKLIFPEQK
ncbi:MAG TPA: lipocalin family protein [Leptospiraceae bacterium]|nr:lipocalin family protein [Leptospiraceae bacterium]HMY67027.1 lipocalin family protein [Leptospiraceae bacterium]HNF25488.1 lipocalin family protein [Leptospiraceae bacterium]HNI96965.1 lipocalin family protein [Leptospiraceae bacterium]HNM03706.1 lipocalin family protein [Leptospiraceae bacterium]